MGKVIYHCDICSKLGKVFLCRYCHFKFCYDCIVKNNPEWLLDNQIDLDHLLNKDKSFTDNNCVYVTCCAFNCVNSVGEYYCFDCGGNYMRQTRCLACQLVFCSLCQKKNLLETKKLPPEKLYNAKMFCSRTCYEIYMEQPNNRWCICEDCGAEYFDLSYRKCCDRCLHKNHFERNVLHNAKRENLRQQVNAYLKRNNLSLSKLESLVEEEINNKVKQYNSIDKMRVDLLSWYTQMWVGYNLSYNIWDEVIEEYILKN